jgi:hypothetical protein
VHVPTGPLAGETLIFLEEPPRRASDPTAARLTASGELVPFAVQRLDDFAITGAAMLPDGDVMIVERRFSWEQRASSCGCGFCLLARSPQARWKGRVLLDADGGTVIDNMEGLAITDHPDGPILTLISDDNGNFFQRTRAAALSDHRRSGSDLPALTPPAPVARPDL